MCRRSIYLGWFALVMGFVATSVVEGSDPSLVGWWKLNEISGTTAADSSGYDNNGTLVGNPKWVTGKIGGALEFDGSGDYVNCGDNAVLQIRDQITMACWIKAPAIASSWATIISKGNDSYRMSRPEGGSAAHIGFDGTSSAPYTWFDGTRTIANNQWHHVAGVYDGSQARIYVDGVLDTAQAATGQLNASTSPLYIGDNAQSPGRYWNGLIDDVRLYNRALTQEEIQVIMLGKSEGFASKPNPENGEPNVARDCVLGWEPGEYADKHNVYFGTIFDDVNTASALNHPNVTFANIDVNHFEPGTLGFDTIHYWRVDEVNAPPDITIYKGDVWSFTVESFAYTLPIASIKEATASSFSPNMGPGKTIDESGLNNNDQHSTASTSMWLSSSSGPQPTWIQYEFDKVYKLHQMWVWNSNQSMELNFGYGMKNVTIEYSPDGKDWKQLDGAFEFAQATGKVNYTHNTTIDFEGRAAKFVKITAISNWKGLFRQYGLSEVRFFYITASAWQPWPASGEIGVSLDAVLSWRAGRDAAVHEVYFSNDMNAVEAGTALVGTVNKTSLPLTPLGLELRKTYYWKVNEVNDSDFPAVWEGDLWSFTTTQYLTVEDFEQYNNSCNRIYYSWTDGLPYDANKACGVPAYNGNGTSSMVGNYPFAPFAERGTVHEGGQSMPLAYYNYNAPYYSETSRQWPVAQDWTRGGAKRLSLWFYGGLGNSAQPLYVVLEDSVGTTKVVSYDNPESILSANWQEWTIPLTSFAGVNLSSVKKMYFGIGDRAAPRADGAGTLYIDDIRLYP